MTHPPGTRSSGKAVFLDRDGTVIRERHYLADPDGVELLPGVTEALRALRDAGFALVMVTNQSGIARGRITEEAYRRVAERVTEVLAAEGVSLDATYLCPHHPERMPPCDCRKPGVGMYRAAERELGVAPEDSWYVGDRVSDVLPAVELGGRGILVRTGYGREEEGRIPEGIVVADDLGAAARLILRTSSLDRE